MSIHAHHRCWIHLVWSTKKREKVLPQEARKQVSQFLYSYAESNNINMKINYVNDDHVHVLIDLLPNTTIQDTVKLLKGSTSHWINKNRIIEDRFSWGRGYSAFSVSHSVLPKVVQYIQDQGIHHRTKSYQDEYKLFMKSNNLFD